MYSFIFDVDGTLIDSYDGITKATKAILDNYNYKMDNVREFILDKSVLDLFKYISCHIGIDSEILFEEYKIEREKTQFEYKFMPNVIESLKYLYSKGYMLFIYTHKGNAINKILSDNGLSYLFTEVISSDTEGFRRKPDPYCINFLVNKYKLDKNNTYYVGDRRIDVTCADNANIKAIFYGDKLKADINILDFNELNNYF